MLAGVAEPIHFRADEHAMERLRAELDQAAELTHRLAECNEAAKGAGAGSGAKAKGTTALGRSGLAGGGARSRPRVTMGGGSGRGGGGLIRDAGAGSFGRGGGRARDHLHHDNTAQSKGMSHSVSLPELRSPAKLAAQLSQRRAAELDWHARQAVATGGSGRWH